MAAVYAGKGEEPVPAWLGDAVLQAEAAPGREQRAPQTRTAWGFAAGLLQRLQEGYRVPAWSLAAGPALAAAVAFAIGVAAFTPSLAPSSVPSMADARPLVLAEADLGPALERTESGRDATVATLRPVLSFRTKADGWCRQAEVRNAARQVSHALACRDEAGRWKVVASTPPGSAGGGFAPAGAGGRKAIDDLATSMMQGSPLSPADEAAAIGRRWRTL
jgi:hypothetical protein